MTFGNQLELSAVLLEAEDLKRPVFLSPVVTLSQVTILMPFPWLGICTNVSTIRKQEGGPPSVAQVLHL